MIYRNWKTASEYIRYFSILVCLSLWLGGLNLMSHKTHPLLAFVMIFSAIIMFINFQRDYIINPIFFRLFGTVVTPNINKHIHQYSSLSRFDQAQKKWMLENIKGPYRRISSVDGHPVSDGITNPSDSYRFLFKKDAMFYKLVWG